jgi:hypothetical protein
MTGKRILRANTFCTVTWHECLPGISNQAGASMRSEKPGAEVKPIAHHTERNEQADTAKYGDGLSKKAGADVKRIARHTERNQQADAAKYCDGLQDLGFGRRTRKRESQHSGNCNHYILTFLEPPAIGRVHKL